MPRPGPRRPGVHLRLSTEGIAWVDAEAKRLKVTRSDVIRAALRAWQALPPNQRTTPPETTTQ